MHFTTTELNDNNQEYQKWYVMHLKQDFFNHLEKSGRLPVSQMSKKIKLQTKLNNYNKKITEIA